MEKIGIYKEKYGMKMTVSWYVTHVQVQNISEETNDSIFRSSTLKIQAASSSEMLVSFYRTTQQQMPEETNFHIHSCEDLESKIA